MILLLGSIQFNERLESVRLFFEAIAKMQTRLDENDQRFKIILTELDKINNSIQELKGQIGGANEG